MKRHPAPARQRGGFLIGFVIGLLIGLSIALGTAIWVTKAPIPFINKVPARPAAQDAAEIERNRNWDPNSALAGRNPAPTASAAAPGSTTPAAMLPPVLQPPVASVMPGPATPAVPAPASVATTRPGDAASAGSARPAQPASPLAGNSTYFVQAGAFARSEDAEQQRAKLALLGIESRLTEREQAGRVVYRVRVGPFERREDADSAKDKLADSGVDSAIVSVAR